MFGIFWDTLFNKIFKIWPFVGDRAAPNFVRIFDPNPLGFVGQMGSNSFGSDPKFALENENFLEDKTRLLFVFDFIMHA
jgi:hypothetical protein